MATPNPSVYLAGVRQKNARLKICFRRDNNNKMLASTAQVDSQQRNQQNVATTTTTMVNRGLNAACTIRAREKRLTAGKSESIVHFFFFFVYIATMHKLFSHTEAITGYFYHIEADKFCYVGEYENQTLNPFTSLR